MKYLFFDIECANRLNKICEFGYVLTDENFNILKKDLKMRGIRLTSLMKITAELIL